ncbi:hypothetical protein QE152_g8087 [Popillia japonica]|uniref:Uncharacterized protein n=1 Tax=Popillia japonica TaxID=7064 RepID=A0AAW1M5P0_POPJA
MSDKLHADILQIKDAIINEAKRAIKKQVSKSFAIRNEIRDSLVQLFNTITRNFAVQTSTSTIESIYPEITDNGTEDSEEETMALSTIESFNLASNLVPLDFDGLFDTLCSVIFEVIDSSSS